jgi:hypothetical protein
VFILSLENQSFSVSKASERQISLKYEKGFQIRNDGISHCPLNQFPFLKIVVESLIFFNKPKIKAPVSHE